MAYILSIGKSEPPYDISQTQVKSLVESLFPLSERDKQRLLPVFDHAMIEKRQFVVNQEWFKHPHGLGERNGIYIKEAYRHSLHAIDDCLGSELFLTEPVSFNDIDMIIFVSTTGLATPSIEARVMNARSFREDVKRVPLFGLGCAGGVSGLARAYDWVKAYPSKNVLVVNVELCSLTFQKTDSKKSNFVGTALFGDGISAVLVAGSKSDLLGKKKQTVPVIDGANSKTKKDSIDIMGWEIKDTGFEVVFNRSIPHLVKDFWKDHVQSFLRDRGLNADELPFFVAHPGGKKVLEAYQEVLQLDEDAFSESYHVLAKHGNMSSVTVCYVLYEYMKSFPEVGTRSLMAALGPGFSSELISLEWY
ncbi:type III polyketide synthase [Thalassobacillus devorans]|uniref:type III polyketide synthase n=1 Tax=Thalassobacillus devorans TaxID=279813 RepID=UPI00048F3C3A|nr:3-oxoacyl-[acyl-carrier-protein] synthase III C-terminal domain-containing protein [Thalassobacillus devorans]